MVGVALGVAVAYEEVDVLADALGAQSGAREARRHGEEVDDAPVAGREDGGHLRVGDVDAGEGHVGLAAGRRFEHGPARGDSIARVDRHDRVAEAERPELFGGRGAGLDPDDEGARSSAATGLGDAEHAALPSRAEDDDHVPRRDQPRDLRRRAGDVERRERHALG